MRIFRIAFWCCLIFAFVNCGIEKRELSFKQAQTGLLNWSGKFAPGIEITGEPQLNFGKVRNLNGTIVIKQIRPSPHGDMAYADLEFKEVNYQPEGSEYSAPSSPGAKLPYSGTGVAAFIYFKNEKWWLKRVKIPGKEWDHMVISTE